MIYAIFLLVIVICYWALWQPDRAFVSGWRRRALWLVVVMYSGLVLLAANGEKPFNSPLFVVFPLLYAVLFRSRLRRMLGRWKQSQIGRAVIIFLLIWFSEIFAALDIVSYDPLGRHMRNYIGFYVGLTLVIVFVLSRWRVTFPALFTVGGLWGILVEQQFLGSKMLVSGNLVGFLIFASFVFPVYGFYLVGPYLLFYEEWKATTNRSRWQYVLLFVALTIIPLVTWGIWTVLLNALGMDTTVYIV